MIKISAYFHKPFETLNLITLSRANFLHNMRVIRDQTGLEVVPVLKANAYGHGLKQIASILAGHSETPFVAVDFYNEALLVRRECNTPVLVMGEIKSDNFKRMKLGGLLFAVSRTDTIEALGSLGKKVNVHVEIDTGMARQGVPLAGLDDLLLLIKEYPHIKVDGVMSHLADADNSFDDSYTHEQTKQFDQAVVRVRAAGFAPRYIHLAQSAGTTRPQSKFVNAVRPGIALYGINPLEKSDSKFEQLQKTKPVMTVWSSIIAVQKLKKGESVSYGRTFTATQPSVIGVLPFGYYEGLPRALSNRAVLLSGSGDKLPVRGRICMNHTMIDITNTQLKVGDKVKIISDNRADPNAVQSLCDSFDLFNYEFLVKINEQTRRIVVG